MEGRDRAPLNDDTSAGIAREQSMEIERLDAHAVSPQRGFLKMLIDEHDNRTPGFTAFINRRRRFDGVGADRDEWHGFP